MVATARSTPVGTHLNDGFSSKIAIAADPDISFWEKSVQPPGFDGGDAIDTTTMHNTTWRTLVARSLKSLTEFTVTAAYDPAILDQINAVINVNGWISFHFPDGSAWNFVGYIRVMEPSENVEGEQPELSITIQPTNQLNGVETEPEYTATGTGT